MKPEEQNVVLARLCGWDVIHVIDVITWSKLRSPDGKIVDSTSGHAELYNFGCIPDYHKDLNAMHEAEKVLGDCEIEWRKYQDWLYVVCEPHRHVINATASQRAEALLKTIGKWAYE